jgi:hypothetical protein
MHVERDAMASRDLAPDAERVADDPGGLIADLGRVARQAGMTFAVNLQVVGADQIDDVLNHRRRRARADVRAIHAGVEIEVDAEKTVRAFESRGCRLLVLAGAPGK